MLKQMHDTGAIDFVFKLLVLNNYGGMREGLHGGSELVRLQRLVNVSCLTNLPHDCGALVQGCAVLAACSFECRLLHCFCLKVCDEVASHCHVQTLRTSCWD